MKEIEIRLTSEVPIQRGKGKKKKKRANGKGRKRRKKIKSKQEESPSMGVHLTMQEELKKSPPSFSLILAGSS